MSKDKTGTYFGDSGFSASGDFATPKNPRDTAELTIVKLELEKQMYGLLDTLTQSTELRIKGRQLIDKAFSAFEAKALSRQTQYINSVLEGLLGELPEKKKKVIKRKGYYPPFQPQVEQHKREGFNTAISEVTKLIKERIK